MANPVKFIEQCAIALQGFGADISDNYTLPKLQKELQKKTSPKELFNYHSLQLVKEMDVCNPGDQTTSKCTLYNALKEDKVVVKEFDFLEASNSNPGGTHSIELMYQHYNIKGKYACQMCFFKKRMSCIIEKFKHVSVELPLEIFSTGSKQTFGLVGIRINKKTDNNESIVCDMALGFKVTESDNKTKRTFLMSALKNSIEFLEVKYLNSSYQILQHRAFNGIDSDTPTVVLIDLKDIYFQNEDLDIVPLESEFGSNITNAFNIGYVKSLDFNSVPDTIQRTSPVKKKSDDKKEDLESDKWSFTNVKTVVFNFVTKSSNINRLKLFLCFVLGVLLIFLFKKSSQEKKPNVQQRISIL